MEDSKRIRLVFKDDDILSETQKSEGLNRSWVLFKPSQYATVSDIASHLLHAFHLHQSCPHGVLLSISGFVLPPFESTCILKDNEIIRVRKRRDILPIEGNNPANEVDKLEAVEKQPVNTGVLLLANEEFVKEKGGYESDDSEEDLLEDMENPSGGNVDPKNRKRKATEKIKVPKKKKQRTEAPGNENARQDGELTKKKSRSSKKKKAEDNVENDDESSKLSDEGDVSAPGIKENAEVKESDKETEDAKVAAKETKKLPSRSARRKYAKRRWLKEMAKIRKTNATCESEGLKNWKEDHANAEWNKVDNQPKEKPKWKKHRANTERTEVDGQPKEKLKWKNHRADTERIEEDGQPKGLLHYKQSPQNERFVKGKKRQRQTQNDYYQRHSNQNGYVHEQQSKTSGGHEQPAQKSDELEKPNEKRGDELPSQENVDVQEHPVNAVGPEQSNQESDEENGLVIPIVVRPGHIRFEPMEKEEAVQKNHVPSETFQWNGITSKKKGQQWGKETRSFTPRNDYKNSNSNTEHPEIPSTEKEKPPVGEIDLDKLPPLPSIPNEGDFIAYRLLELSSSWTPELSDLRVGKVSWFDVESNQTLLAPVPEYPIVSKKGDDDEDEDVQPDNSLYKEDGSLEIDFSSLIDVRIVENGNSGPGNVENAPKIVVSTPEDGEINPGKDSQPITAENGGANLWDQVTEALNAKKEQLAKESGWGKTPPKKVQVQSHENSWGKNGKMVQPSPGNSWGKNAQKVQPPMQENSWGKQNSGGKSWSYKALRGSALGPTMAILRSKKGI